MTSPDHRQAAVDRDEFDATLEGRKARWEALPDPERESIRARFDRANPMPARMHAGLWELTRRLACLDLMDGSGPVVVARAARPPDPQPAPIRDPSPDPPRPTAKQRRQFLDGLTDEDRARFEDCSPGRQDELVLMRANAARALGGERIGRKPDPVPRPDPVPEPEPDWSFV